MAGLQRPSRAVMLVLLLVCSTTLSILSPSETIEATSGGEWVEFELRDGVYAEAVGAYGGGDFDELRALEAVGPFGTFDTNGLRLNSPVPQAWMEPRLDALVLIIADDVHFADARAALSDLQGLAVREFIAPSGLLVQGTPMALQQAAVHPHVAAHHAAPLGMFVHQDLMDVLLLEGGEEALSSTLVRVDGWRDADGPLETVQLHDGLGGSLVQRLGDVVASGLSDSRSWDEGRYEGYLLSGSIVEMALQPSVMFLRPDPAFATFNDQARSHMGVNTMTSYFTTDLDGSGQLVAVADAGLDEDHGDFGSRVVGSYDVIGDGSTADMHSGHGTHVACSVLGDGYRGGYRGVARSAELYFQAMENDNTGNFQSPSLNYLLNTAYNANARIHTNSWGSSAASEQGKYNSETEDVDDRANYYDKYYASREGLTVLFAAGNDGPDTGTVSPPATAKNVISVGNHQNRYNGAPDTVWSGSSRGPTEDGRIKPDLVAPGAYVRSCRAQEAADTGTSTWSNTHYLEYTGTSMATPNAAGAATLIREYLIEIAQRPSPQGALIKALMVLGAQDIGGRDVPNDDEGWGRVNLRNTLAPPGGQGIWVDDRSYLSRSGTSKTYSFNITQSTGALKAVLTWSDERGSRFSTAQLVNDLDLVLQAPDGTEYLGNDFANGRSVTGGARDTVNNLEVALIDNAQQGVWTVTVNNAQHSGSSSQPYAIAVMGHGVNDLRPDPMVVPEEFEMDVGIPQVGDPVNIVMGFFNFGNVRAETFPIAFEVDGTELDRQSMDLGSGVTRTLVWSWTPQTAGSNNISFIVDPDDSLEEIRENNNRFDIQVNVTAPGVKLETPTRAVTLLSSTNTTTSWNLTLTNTALVPTNASMQTGEVLHVESNSVMPWYVGTTEANFSLEGQGSEYISVTLVHPAPPAPGTYRIDLLGLDVDNAVNYPLNLDFIVPNLAEAALEYDYQTVPVHPSDPTNITVRFLNNGNAPIGYDLFLQAPPGWRAGFTNLGSEAGATSGSTGLIANDAFRAVGLMFTPPQVMTAAGAERVVTLSAISQTEQQERFEFTVPIQVTTVDAFNINLESNLGTVRPDSSVSMMFSLEHRGNIDLNLTPSFTLPGGWSVSSSLTPFDLDWASSKNLLYTLQAGPNARSGDVVLNFDNGSERYTWTRSLVVERLPEPTMTFVGLELQDGTRFGSPEGSGSHPSGESMTFTWLLSNSAETEWAPSISIQADDGLFGDCSTVETVSRETPVPLVCTMLIANGLAPMSEPSFTLNLADNGVDLTTTVGLLVAENEAVRWNLGQVPSFTTGDEREIRVEITNTGNTPLQRQVRIDAADDWNAKVDGNDIVNLEVGQSALVRLNVRADSPGERNITLVLVQSPSSSASFSFAVSATGEPVGTAGDAGLSSSVTLGLLALVLLVTAGFAVNQRRSSSPSKSLSPPLPSLPALAKPVPVVPIQPAVQPMTSPAPTCWACRQPVTSSVVGCPSCGARYHGDSHVGCSAGELETCVNCGSPSDAFVQA